MNFTIALSELIFVPDCDKYKLYKTKYKNPSETKFLKPLSSTTLIKTLIKSTTTQVKTSSVLYNQIY